MRNWTSATKSFFTLLIRKQRIVYFSLCFALIASLQWQFLNGKIKETEPRFYKELATDLRVTSEYRYGYVWSYYGAMLIKTPNDSSFTPGNQKVITDKDSTLKRTMGRELTLAPFKAVIELVFYIALLVYVFFGVRWFKMKFPQKEGHPSVQLCLGALAWILFWVMALLPGWLFGYGEPFHTKALGPGALISTPSILSHGNALTVSYRFFIETLNLFPLMFGTSTNYAFKYVPGIRDHVLYSLWLLGFMFYGMAGFLYELIKGWIVELGTSFRVVLLFILIVGMPACVYLGPRILPPLPEAVRAFTAKIDACDKAYGAACEKFLMQMKTYEEKKRWPKTLAEAVHKAISSLSAQDKEIIRNVPDSKELQKFFYSWGLNIRNQFGLWKGNRELMKACGAEKMHPDDASWVIMLAAWRELRKGDNDISPQPNR